MNAKELKLEDARIKFERGLAIRTFLSGKDEAHALKRYWHDLVIKSFETKKEYRFVVYYYPLSPYWNKRPGEGAFKFYGGVDLEKGPNSSCDYMKGKFLFKTLYNRLVAFLKKNEEPHAEHLVFSALTLY